MEKKFLSQRYREAVSTPMAEAAERAWEQQGLINLSLGDPDLITDQRIIEKAFEDARQGHTKYTDPLGDLEVRQALSERYRRLYQLEFKMEEIMMVVGACHGMHLVLEAILDEGDEVLVPEPYFTPYLNQIKLARGRMVPLQTREDQGFQIDAAALEALITSRTKAIILNTPNNPTGICYSQSTLEAIAVIAKEKDLVVIADDVYGAFCYHETFYPIAAINGMKERTITIGSFSKDYAMTGWRIGYVLAPEYLISCIKDINEGVCFTAPSISQRAALHALRQSDAIQPGIIKEYRERVFYAYKRINAIPNMSVCSPEGSFYLFVNIKKTGLTSAEVCSRLLKEAQILAVPGSAFGDSGEGYLRIACTVGTELLKDAFDRIERMPIFGEAEI